MKQILLVDKDPELASALAALTSGEANAWSVEHASGAEEASDKLHGTIDVLIASLDWPQMTGIGLLKHVKENHPQVLRIVLSEHNEVEATLRALPIAHQFLSKPCSAEILLQTLERARATRQLIQNDTLRELVAKVDELPTRPRVYNELTQILARQDYALSDVASVIENDIGISTKLLQLVNTAFFSRGATVTRIRTAVARLGAALIRDLVLGVEVFRTFQGIEHAGLSLDELHTHSFIVGSIAKRLVGDPRRGDDAFLAATVHDVGKLLLVKAAPNAYPAIVRSQIESGEPLHELEQSALGVTHAEVGAYLLGLWGLSYRVVDAVAHHHHPERAGSQTFDTVAAVYVANILAHEAKGEPADPLNEEWLAKMGVARKLDGWRELALSVVEGKGA